MLYRTAKQKLAEDKELEGAKFHRFSDTTMIAGTGVFADMPAGKQYKVHRLVADVLIEKKYAKAV